MNSNAIKSAVLVTENGREEQAFYSNGDLVEVGNPIGDERVKEIMRECKQTSLLKRTADFNWLEDRGDYPDRIEDVKLTKFNLGDVYAD